MPTRLVDHVLTWSEATLAVLGVLGALGVAMRSLYRMARNVERLVETSESNALRLQHIEKQVNLNGGTSLRDAVHRIEMRLEKVEHLPCHLHQLPDVEVA
jgi:hypothetical protein